jgi:uncharacterized Fe-S center protein
MSTVYLMPMSAEEGAEIVHRKVTRLWSEAGFDAVFSANDLAALKLHVGEPGTTTFTPPKIAAAIVRRLTAAGARPFLTDSAVLYRSPRDNGPGHARVAHEHGFTFDAVGAPFIPADGVNGSDAHELPLPDGRHFTSVVIAAAILHARSILVLSHATGHLGTGLGAALKNLGMGCAAKRAKLQQHHGQQPRIDPATCTACAVCAEWCPANAITVDDHATISSEACIGCGECVAACQEGAVTYDWGIAGTELQERMVEHAAALIRTKPDRMAYINVAMSITKDCDCLGLSQPPLLPDIGLLASRDPVALDQATLDLVADAAGTSLESLSYPGHDATVQIRYAETLGIGSARYDLIRLEP